jgi:hypothetical protein
LWDEPFNQTTVFGLPEDFCYNIHSCIKQEKRYWIALSQTLESSKIIPKELLILTHKLPPSHFIFYPATPNFTKPTEFQTLDQEIQI